MSVSFVIADSPGLDISARPNLYGSNVTLRTAYLPSGAKKSWVIYEPPLPPGKLTKYFFYVHNISLSEQQELYVQIWRPVDTTTFNYRLVWSQRVTVDLSATSQGSFYTVSCTLILNT